MERDEEREIMSRLKALAIESEGYEQAHTAALEKGDREEAHKAQLAIARLMAHMDPDIERLYLVHHPKAFRQARHSARSHQHAERIEQDAWIRFRDALANFDLGKPAFPLLSYHVRMTAIDFYRRLGNRVPLSGTVPDRPDLRPGPEEQAISSDTFLRILHYAMSRKGGPAHERVSFGFNRLLEEAPREVVEARGPHLLKALAKTLREEYLRRSGLPVSHVAGAFREMEADMKKHLSEVDPKTAANYRNTRLPDLKLGDGPLQHYFGDKPKESYVMGWADNVIKRLKAHQPAGTSAGARSTGGRFQ